MTKHTLVYMKNPGIYCATQCRFGSCSNGANDPGLQKKGL